MMVGKRHQLLCILKDCHTWTSVSKFYTAKATLIILNKITTGKKKKFKKGLSEVSVL